MRSGTTVRSSLGTALKSLAEDIGLALLRIAKAVPNSAVPAAMALRRFSRAVNNDENRSSADIRMAALGR